VLRRHHDPNQGGPNMVTPALEGRSVAGRRTRVLVSQRRTAAGRA